MSKPILSELEYNADDVASAILSKADLAVTNEDLGVTNQSSIVSYGEGWAGDTENWFSFNGFMFVSGRIYHSGGEPDTGETVITITDPDLFPEDNFLVPGMGTGPDTSNYLRFEIDGDMKIYSPANTGSTTWQCTYSGFYRY